MKLQDKDKDRTFDQEGRYLPGRPAFREFVTTVNSADFERHAGIGLTVDEVIADHAENYRGAWENNLKDAERVGRPATPPEEWIREAEDLVVWEGVKVVAVLRGTVGALPGFEVVRFDVGPSPRPSPAPIEPAPPGPVTRRVNPDVARPLLRSTLTFNPPSAYGPDGPPDPVTIQVVITDDGKEDLPELQEAGWFGHVLSNYSVHMRIVS